MDEVKANANHQQSRSGCTVGAHTSLVHGLKGVGPEVEQLQFAK